MARGRALPPPLLVAAIILSSLTSGRSATLPALPPCAGEGCGGLPAVCRFDDTYPKQYVAYYTASAPVVDGNLNDAAWGEVGWSDKFVDIQGNERVPSPPRFDTRVKMRWDDAYLYIAAEMQEPQVWANITRGPDVIFNDNDFEVFVDPGGSNHFYKEFEVNAKAATWALCLNRPYSDGGYENSSRILPGGWSMPKALAATHVDGRVDDPSVPCSGWTAELALPLADLTFNTSRSGKAPADGSLWRINFSRVEWRVQVVDGKYQKLPGPEDNWVWSPQGVVDMHQPDRWGVLQFARGAPNSTAAQRDPHWTLREVAMAVYYAQRRHRQVFGFYASYASQLDGLSPRPHALDGTCASVPFIIVPSDGYYVASVRSLSGTVEARVDALRRLQVKHVGGR